MHRSQRMPDCLKLASAVTALLTLGPPVRRSRRLGPGRGPIQTGASWGAP